MFITVEGIDGSGKTTLVEGLSRRLGPGVVVTMEPWDPAIKAALRPLMDKVGGRDEALAEFFLFSADRALHSRLIRDALSEGKVVISDRYLDSSVAYQGPRLGMDFEEALRWMMEVSRFFPTPDITLLLDLDPRVALGRISDRDTKIGYEKVEFLVRVRDWYLRLADRFPERIKVLDASLPPERVLEDALRELGGAGIGP